MKKIKNTENIDKVLIENIKSIILNARKNVYHKVNVELLATYWRIGQEIVETEQQNNIIHNANNFTRLNYLLNNGFKGKFNLENGKCSKNKTSFLPNFFDKTTSVAKMTHTYPQPHHLIKNQAYESRIL
jgi:hypothetical protein